MKNATKIASAGLAFCMLFLTIGCSSKSSSDSSAAETSWQKEQENDTPAVRIVDNKSLDMDSLRSLSISTQYHNRKSSMEVSVNPYYDEGYDNGLDDGYYDGQENIRGDSYDDSNDYRGRKRKEYELGYEEGYEAGFDDGFADSDYDSEEEE